MVYKEVNVIQQKDPNFLYWNFFGRILYHISLDSKDIKKVPNLITFGILSLWIYRVTLANSSNHGLLTSRWCHIIVSIVVTFSNVSRPLAIKQKTLLPELRFCECERVYCEIVKYEIVRMRNWEMTESMNINMYEWDRRRELSEKGERKLRVKI